MDPIDGEIVKRLRGDGRISFRDLGEAVGLSANAVAERVRRLVASGTIRRFTAELDPAAHGMRLAAFIDQGRAGAGRERAHVAGEAVGPHPGMAAGDEAGGGARDLQGGQRRLFRYPIHVQAMTGRSQWTLPSASTRLLKQLRRSWWQAGPGAIWRVSYRASAR